MNQVKGTNGWISFPCLHSPNCFEPESNPEPDSGPEEVIESEREIVVSESQTKIQAIQSRLPKAKLPHRGPVDFYQMFISNFNTWLKSQ